MKNLILKNVSCAVTLGAALYADVVIAQNIPTGDVVSEQGLTIMRTSGGLGALQAPSPCAPHPLDVLTLPSIGRQTSSFGLRPDPLGAGVRLHAGIDFAAPQGSLVVSAGSGEVQRAGWVRGYGNLIIIDHGQGLTTRYAHLERSLVRTGQEVRSGEKIGLVGATGHATGSHLHFEIRESGRALDPQAGDVACPNLAVMAPTLGEVPPRSRWSEGNSDGALPTVILP